MKLLLITAVQEYRDSVKKILINSGVKTFTYMDAKGYRDSTMDGIENNWFGSEMNESESYLFLAFVPTDIVSQVNEAVNTFNKSREVISYIHVAVMPMNQINE